MKDYDLAISFRAYPGISKQPIGEFKSKLEMFQVNLFSLLKALDGLKAYFHLILDGCDESFADFARKLIPEQDLEIVFTQKIGNEKTFLLQMDWLLNQPYAENIFFAEDDYVYQAGSFKSILNLLENPDNKVDFVSPHNHGDYYNSRLQQILGSRLLYKEGKQWHLSASTCLTFFSKRQVLRETQAVFKTYERGNLDFTIFMALTMPGKFILPPALLLTNSFFMKCLLKAWWMSGRQIISGKSYRLAVPIEAAGTHLQFDEIGPGVNWTELISIYKTAIQQKVLNQEVI
jgi:hypothetical protein